jgi:hypothetical protein
MQSGIRGVKRQSFVFKTIQQQLFSPCLDVFGLQNWHETAIVEPVSLSIRRHITFNVKSKIACRGGIGTGDQKEFQWRAITGMATLPSSKTLWDILKKEQIEGHDARHIHDIWMEVMIFSAAWSE